MYDIRDSKPYTVRKLADGSCRMVDNLAMELEENSTYTGVNNATGEEITFNTGTACSSNGACTMNGNTKHDSITDQWYYSWYAATAGSGTSGQTNTDAPYSICPKGWRLPNNYTLSTTKSYGSLTNAYNLTSNGNWNTTNYTAQLESFPLNFARLGYYRNSSSDLTNNGIYGCYWSSTAFSNATRAYFFFYTTSYTYPQNDFDKYFGFVIRCVAL